MIRVKRNIDNPVNYDRFCTGFSNRHSLKRTNQITENVYI